MAEPVFVFNVHVFSSKAQEWDQHHRALNDQSGHYFISKESELPQSPNNFPAAKMNQQVISQCKKPKLDISEIFTP